MGLSAAGLFLVLPPTTARAVVPPDSPFFSTVSIESADSLSTVSDGDLWPTCWSDDGNLYAAMVTGRVSRCRPFAPATQLYTFRLLDFVEVGP